MTTPVNETHETHEHAPPDGFDPPERIPVKAVRTNAPAYTQTFPRRPESVAAARRVTFAVLNIWQLDALADSAVLVCSELVTNSVDHARGGSFRLTVTRRRTGARISVVDLSHCEPAMRRKDTGDERGRGLVIVDTLAARWGTDRLRWGKRVWADLDVL